MGAAQTAVTMRTAVVLVAFLTACATSSNEAADGMDPGGTSQGNDQAEDEAVEEDETPPGPASTECKADEHACETSCVANRDNDPSVGCMLGCGGACPAPERALVGQDGSGRVRSGEGWVEPGPAGPRPPDRLLISYEQGEPVRPGRHTARPYIPTYE